MGSFRRDINVRVLRKKGSEWGFGRVLSVSALMQGYIPVCTCRLMTQVHMRDDYLLMLAKLPPLPPQPLGGAPQGFSADLVQGGWAFGRVGTISDDKGMLFSMSLK